MIDDAYRFVLRWKDVILKYVAAMLLLVPGAFLLAPQFFVVPGMIAFPVLGWPDPETTSIPDNVFFALVLVCWAVLLYWATATDSIGRTIARSCWAFSTGAFLLPTIGIAVVIFGPPDPPDQIFPKWMLIIVASIIGLVLGFIARALAVNAAPEGSPEKSGGTWYVFRPIGGGYFALAVGLLLIVAIALRLNRYEGLLN